MLLVTGGAGFIGSNVVAALNDAGRADVAVCDLLGEGGKWRNLAKRRLADIFPPKEMPAWLSGRKLEAVIHLGAISDTTATDGDLVIETNFRFSLRLLDWCTATGTPFIYASSAATYGDGAQGFSDDASLPAAVGGSAFAIFHNQGQACIAGSRLILHEKIADAFLESFLALARTIRHRAQRVTDHICGVADNRELLAPGQQCIVISNHA